MFTLTKLADGTAVLNGSRDLPGGGHADVSMTLAPDDHVDGVAVADYAEGQHQVAGAVVTAARPKGPPPSRFADWTATNVTVVRPGTGA